MSETLGWRVDVKSVILEIMVNPHTQVLEVPMKILYNLMQQVAKRAIELDDPELNTLMIRLALYSIADPASEDFDPDLVNKLIMEATK